MQKIIQRHRQQAKVAKSVSVPIEPAKQKCLASRLEALQGQARAAGLTSRAARHRGRTVSKSPADRSHISYLVKRRALQRSDLLRQSRPSRGHGARRGGTLPRETLFPRHPA
ncbi:hypothetical protein AAFF_G00352750 [Aldrovandia affinis]|uniref:Uncharacterized protein n=1 Tax=Aldrovandia affinis TaxID=143900 RepID=A0AAD7SJP1_9TELE|nr:hypothetical protein AAFF_G00352750 [Aldrovandia affinis]